MHTATALLIKVKIQKALSGTNLVDMLWKQQQKSYFVRRQTSGQRRSCEPDTGVCLDDDNDNENHLLPDPINSFMVWRSQGTVLRSSLWSAWKTFTARHAQRCRISCRSQMFQCRCSRRSLEKEKLFCLESCARVCCCSDVHAHTRKDHLQTITPNV